jgi:protein O-GlcNAcase/histone acetyltransferase
MTPTSDIIFLGPKVVSKDITVESIEEVSKILKRAPVIWDNIHANDYDQKRLFLGPYKGRSTELIPRLKGVLTNPNCEFESNFVAIHTLATWYKSNMNGVRKDVAMSKSDLISGTFGFGTMKLHIISSSWVRLTGVDFIYLFIHLLY